ncbi:MAG TPA: CRTAC1 family protein [Vicinamibacteria bacterium]|nr:CRTAC1 family protein [Vicinamibacteria bacterium]
MRTPLALGVPLGLLLAGARPLPPTVVAPPLSPQAAPGVTFADATRASGLASFHRQSGSPAKDYLLEAKGGGVAVTDFDGDGWPDVYLVNGATFEALRGRAEAPPSALFRNDRDGTFTDVTTEAGVANRGWGQGACTGDYDNDGDEDLYVTNFGPNRLYRNEGQGRFTDVAAASGVALGGWSTGCAFGDYDGDGRLDLFVAGNIIVDLERLPPAPSAAARSGPAPAEGRSGATSGSMQAPYRPGLAFCEYRGVPAMCGPKGLKGAPDHLFHNEGDGTFSDVSVKAGVADPNGYYGLGVAFLDFDDDGWLDLFVANDSCPNYLYRNRGDGTFQDVSLASGAAFNEAGQEQAHMGVAVGDYDRDGRDDLLVTNFENDANILYHNEGGGLFSEATYPAGVGTASVPFVGWGTNFLDYDNDGWLDLFVANGHVYPFVDRFDWNTSYEERALLFRNVKGKFVEVGRAGDGLAALRSMRGSATGDIDNDGDVDVVVNSIDGEPLLLRNDGGNRAGHWLSLRLVGDPARRCPRDATGSVVFLTAAGARQRGEVASGRSLLSQSDRRVHFGLGPAVRVERLEVRWANGPTVAYEVPGVDRELLVDQARGVLSSEAAPPAGRGGDTP